MASIFTIYGESGKAMDLTGWTPEQLRATGIRMSFRNLGTDTLTFSIPLASLASTAEIVPEMGQIVQLYRNGVCIFLGHVTGRRQKGRNIFVTVSGPWWWLERIFLESSVADSTGALGDRPTYAFGANSLTVSLKELADKAIALGVPFKVGTLATTFVSPPMKINQSSYAGAMADLVRVTPDMVLYFDYSVYPPSLNSVRRLSAPSLTLDARNLADFELDPVTELEVTQVRVPYVTRADDGKRQFASQNAGVPQLGKVYLHVVSGEELDTYLPADKVLDSVLVKTDTAEISTDLVMRLDPAISAARVKFGVPQLGDIKQYVKIWYGRPGAWTLLENGPPSKCVDESGNNVALSGKFITTLGSLPDWAVIQLGGKKVTYSGTWYGVYGAKNLADTAQRNPAWLALSAGQVTGSGWSAKPTKSAPVQNIYVWYKRPYSFTATILKTAYPSKTKISRGADFNFRNPPADYAAGLLAAQNYVPYQGEFRVAEDDAGAFRYMAYAMNFSNSQAAHGFVRAMVTEESIEIATGQTTVFLGAPARFAYRELVNRVRPNPNDQIIYL